MKNLVPIKIKTLKDELYPSDSSRQLVIGTFVTTHGDLLFRYGIEDDSQPYILLGKDALYDILPSVLEEVEKDISLWLTDKNDSKRKLAEIVASWKKIQK